jgi:hypothetical protein
MDISPAIGSDSHPSSRVDYREKPRSVQRHRAMPRRPVSAPSAIVTLPLGRQGSEIPLHPRNQATAQPCRLLQQASGFKYKICRLFFFLLENYY